MKDIAVALMVVGIVASCCWGLVSCNRQENEAIRATQKLYIEKGFHQDSWGRWVKDAEQKQ